MTYEINSAWTGMHKDEIIELNRISNQRYRIENEIARKLRIIAAAKKAVAKEIKRFNFDAVINFMTQVGWKWSYTTNGEAVPTKEDFIKLFNHDFLDHALYDMIELGKNDFCSSTGGVIFQMGCSDLGYATENNTYCAIAFDISQWRDEFAE